MIASAHLCTLTEPLSPGGTIRTEVPGTFGRGITPTTTLASAASTAIVQKRL